MAAGSSGQCKVAWCLKLALWSLILGTANKCGGWNRGGMGLWGGNRALACRFKLLMGLDLTRWQDITSNLIKPGGWKNRKVFRNLIAMATHLSGT